MRVSISNLAWDPVHDQVVSEILRSHDVDAIDIAPGKYFSDFSATTLEQIRAVRCWWAERDIEIIGMQSLLYGTQGLNVFASVDVQNRMLDHLRHVCRIGAGLNAQRIVFGSPRNRDRSGLTDDQSLEIAALFFRRLADIAQEHGVTVCLEPNPVCYGANFMTTTRETVAVVLAVDHPALKLQLDTGALCINAESAVAVCDQYQHLIGHVHVSEPQLVPVGTGATDHVAAAAALRTCRPEAPVTIEMLTQSVEDVLAAVDASVRFVTACYGSGSRSMG
ncbi:MAG: TIM barrel protein [Cyanobacteriota bacterium]|nr:TIM barrel protein [Cyanobacteriota bacterium]